MDIVTMSGRIARSLDGAAWLRRAAVHHCRCAREYRRRGPDNPVGNRTFAQPIALPLAGGELESTIRDPQRADVSRHRAKSAERALQQHLSPDFLLPGLLQNRRSPYARPLIVLITRCCVAADFRLSRLMESEALRLLRQRQDELTREKASLQTRLGPIISELDQIDIAIRAMTGKVISASGTAASSASVAHHKRIAHPDIQKLTFKQLIVKALGEHFTNGATANELLELFERKWGRRLMRTSLSPQLSRLKNDKIIELEGKVWHLSKPVKAFGVPGLFPNENGEAEASPDVAESAISAEHEPNSGEQPSRGGPVPGKEETT